MRCCPGEVFFEGVRSNLGSQILVAAPTPMHQKKSQDFFNKKKRGGEGGELPYLLVILWGMGVRMGLLARGLTITLEERGGEARPDRFLNCRIASSFNLTHNWSWVKGAGGR